MDLKEDDFKSEIAKRLYKKWKDKMEREQEGIPNNIALEPLPGTQSKQIRGVKTYDVPITAKPEEKKSKIKEKGQQSAAKPKTAEKNLADIIQYESAGKQEADEHVAAEPKQEPKPYDRAAKKEQKPADYRIPTRRETLQMCEQMGVIGEKVTLLKLISNICIKKSTLVEGASNAGKSWLLDHVFELVPDNMKCKTNDSRNFFDLAKRYNGQFPFIVMGELQTFLRGSKNEKDIMRCIGNGEVYNFPLEDGKNLPISAWGVYASIADSNRYKKLLVDCDKELLRRFHRVYIQLTDEKMKQRLDAIARQQMPTYSSASEKEADLDMIRNHIEKTILLEIPQKRFFNPFARYLIEYISESCRGAGTMEEAAKIATYHKNYVIAGTKWNAKYRQFGKGNDFRFIASIGDAYVAKMLTDTELQGEKKPFDGYACWVSAVESLKASGYPAEIINAYIKRQVSADNKIYINDPITGKQVLLADLNMPRPANIIVTKEKYEKIPEDSTIDTKVTDNEVPEEVVEPEILDAEYKIIESGEKDAKYALPFNAAGYLPAPEDEKDPETAGPSEKSNLPVLYGKNYPAGKTGFQAGNINNGLPFTNRKYLTCKNDRPD